VKAVPHHVDETVQGAHVLALLTLGFRNIYSKKEVKKIEDIKGMKVRVQATPTEDTMFPPTARSRPHAVRQRLHLAADRHGRRRRERRQRLPGQQALRGGAGHVDDRARGQQQPAVDQRQAVVEPDGRAEGLGAGRCRRGGQVQPAKALDLETQSAAKLKGIGVKIVEVDKSGFIKIAEPNLEKMAKDLGPHAAKIQQLISAVK
jgi:hypothetical protein